MYLLLPLKPSPLAHANTNINWAVIDACTSVVEYLRSGYSLDGEYCPGSSSTALNSTGRLSEEMIHLANKSLNIWCLKDSVVLSIHTGRIYSVLDVIYDSTPESSFAEMSDEKPTSFASFADYYYQKYMIAQLNILIAILQISQLSWVLKLLSILRMSTCLGIILHFNIQDNHYCY